MKYEVTAICQGVHSLAIWDSSWNSYNNCYLLKRDHEVIMIDCGKMEHGEALLDALRGLGIGPLEVTQFIATHGHEDHVGASSLFENAQKWIHAQDTHRLNDVQRLAFHEIASKDGELCGLSYTLLGHHTDGSLALFDPVTGCLFCGDHICFFGAKTQTDGFLTFGSELRTNTRNFVRQWSNSPEDRSTYRFDRYISGLQSLSRHDAAFLATGHGPVLTSKIAEFLTNLVDSQHP